MQVAPLLSVARQLNPQVRQRCSHGPRAMVNPTAEFATSRADCDGASAIRLGVLFPVQESRPIAGVVTWSGPVVGIIPLSGFALRSRVPSHHALWLLLRCRLSWRRLAASSRLRLAPSSTSSAQPQWNTLPLRWSHRTPRMTSPQRSQCGFSSSLGTGGNSSPGLQGSQSGRKRTSSFGGAAARWLWSRGVGWHVCGNSERSRHLLINIAKGQGQSSLCAKADVLRSLSPNGYGCWLLILYE